MDQLRKPREDEDTLTNGLFDGFGGEQAAPGTPGARPSPMTPAGLSRAVEIETFLAGALERVERDFAALRKKDEIRDERLRTFTAQINQNVKKNQETQSKMNQAIERAGVETTNSEQRMRAWTEEALTTIWKRSQQAPGVSSDQLQPFYK